MKPEDKGPEQKPDASAAEGAVPPSGETEVVFPTDELVVAPESEVVDEVPLDVESDEEVLSENPRSEPLAIEPAPEKVERVLGEEVLRKYLPNGSCGSDYEVRVKEFFFGERASEISWFNLTLPLELGLEYSNEEDRLFGIPKVAGDFTAELKYLWKNHASMTPENRTVVNLVINPDPRSLWKNLPSDAEGIFAKPDSDCCSLEAPWGTVIAGSQRGRSHAHVGGFRDDDFEIRHFPASGSDEGWFCLAVADGAGSASYSREGAAIACRTSVECCETFLRADVGGELNVLAEQFADGAEEVPAIRTTLYRILVHAAHAAYQKIKKTAESVPDAEVRDFHTTLLLAIARRFPSGQWFFAGFSVGDGAMAVLNEKDGEGSLVALGKPDSGEFAGQTSFLTMGELWQEGSGQKLMERLHFTRTDSFTAFLSMTDGVSDPFFQSDQDIESPQEWSHLWQVLTKGDSDIGPGIDLTSPPANAAEQLRDWLDFFSKGHHDDRTLAVFLPKALSSSPRPQIIADE